MTLEAWVNPNPGGDFRTLVVKERPGDLVYGIYSSSDTNRPQSQVTIGGTVRLLNGTATIPSGAWTHLAATYDGTTQRLFVNGTQVSTLALSGAITTSNNPLKIGGNSIWAEWFTGLIDEVRVYNRALSVGEIQADMNTAISQPGPDSSERAGHAHRGRVAQRRAAELGRGDGQRRRRQVQRPPLDDPRFHAYDREPDRTANGNELTRTTSRPAPTSTR